MARGMPRTAAASGQGQCGIHRPCADAEMPADITVTRSVTQAASRSAELCGRCCQSRENFRLAHRNHLRAQDLVPQGLQGFNQVTKNPHAHGSRF